MIDEEYDKFYKRASKMYSDSIIRMLNGVCVSKHEKRVYMENLDKNIEKLEQIVD